MAQRPESTRWNDVDRMHDAQSAATFLDRATAQESVRAYKAQSFALLAPKAGAALLEVGCGTGMDVRALAMMVAPDGRVVGVDRSETLLTETRRQTHVAGVTIEFRQGDAHRRGGASRPGFAIQYPRVGVRDKPRQQDNEDGGNREHPGPPA
jgi:ubiquinone/menaquinone biosynthesis C-methylase UbiE